jgi:hypothetical protein
MASPASVYESSRAPTVIHKSDTDQRNAKKPNKSDKAADAIPSPASRTNIEIIPGGLFTVYDILNIISICHIFMNFK